VEDDYLLLPSHYAEYAESISSAVFQVTANGSNSLTVNGVRCNLCTGAVLLDDLGGVQGANISGFTGDGTLSKILGNSNGFAQVTFHGFGPTASDVSTPNEAIRFDVHPKQETWFGTQQIKTFEMPAAGVQWYEEAYKFNGTTNYLIQRTATTWCIADFNSGTCRFTFDWQNNRFNVVSGTLSVGGGGNVSSTGAGGTMAATIASGTATMTTAAITGPNCGTTVTVAATGVATTDTITFADNAAPAAATNGPLVIKAWPTANNVNFMYCVQSGTITPAAATLNWRVMR
jgi:hypothetical protein